jgi:hypothetical protein
MPAASDISIHVASITGIPHSTVFGVKRRFIETGIWPSARGSNIPDLDTKDVVHLIFALLADVHAKDAASAAVDYFNLTDSHGQKLGDTVVGIIDTFRSGKISPLANVAYRSTLEVDCLNPRACLSMDCGMDGHEEILFGAQAAQWKDAQVRRSMTISGKCLFDIAQACTRAK